jgi:hypothetical protein
MKRRWGVCLIASIPNQGEHKRKCGSSERWSSLHIIDSIRSWVFISMLQPCNGSKERTHWIVGDRLLIPTFHQLPQMRTFPAWDNFKQTQALPLKEDFRQFARSNNRPGLQTTWRRKVYTSKQMLNSKASKFKELKQLKYLKKSNLLVNKSTVQTKRNG